MFDAPIETVFEVVAFLFALSLHQAAQAFVADKLGDDTARQQGRVTMNPWVHMDFWGTVILPAISILGGMPVLGWGKPVPADPSRFRRPRRDDLAVIASGWMANVSTAAACATLLITIRLLFKEGAVAVGQLGGGYAALLGGPRITPITPVALLLYSLLYMSVLLAVFNLLPIPGLDGGLLLGLLIPAHWQGVYARLYRFNFLILMLMLLFRLPYVMFEPVIGLFNRLLFI